MRKQKERIGVLLMGNDISIPSNGMITVMKMIYQSAELNKQFDFKTVFFSFPMKDKITKIVGAAKSVPKFFKVLRDVDVIHIHHSTGLNLIMTMFFAFLGSLFRKKVILHNHAGDFREYYGALSGVARSLIRGMFERADAAITVSESWEKWHRESVSRKAKWMMMHNPSPLQSPEPNRVNGDQLSVLYMSRLQERKGVYDLLDVIPEVVTKVPTGIFFLAGDAEVEKVSAIVADMRMTKHIKILGWVDGTRKVDLLKKSTIFVMPSYHEGLPMALLEAMAFGIPCVVTAVGGIPEVIRDGENGMLIDPGDRAGLKEAILSLASDAALREKMGLAAFNTIRQSYSTDGYLSRLASLYNGLVEGTAW